MTTAVQISPRDSSLLKLLSWTPATTTLLLQVSRTFDGGPYIDERRLRERLQVLEHAGYTRHWSTASIGGGLQNYYKLTTAGYQILHGPDVELPPRSFFAELAPSNLRHTLQLAEAIVATVCAAHFRRITIEKFYRENELRFEVGDAQVQPDCFFRFATSGLAFNVAFELDLSTETVDSPSDRSLRSRIELYDAYQEQLLQGWLAGGRTWERPRFRVVFLTVSVLRAYHILAVMASSTRHPDRRLIYAATQDSYLGNPQPLTDPFLLDHRGTWQALVDLHPTAPSKKGPVRLPQSIGSAAMVW